MTQSRRGRAGMTLVEMLIALVLFGIVGGSVMTVLIRQQRLSTRTAGVVDTRDQSRIAFATLAAELKALSSVGGDIDPTDWTATSIRVRTLVGTSVACMIAGNRQSFIIPPAAPVTPPATGVATTLTSFVNPTAPIAVNDTVWVFNSLSAMATPWTPARVTATATVSGAAGCPNGAAGNYLSAADAAGQSISITIDPAFPPAGIDVGAPVRVTRTVRYSFQEEPAGSGRAYLMFQTCTGGACTAAQPVAGPFLPATANASTTGFRFTYFDSTGAVAALPTNVARIGIYLRSASRDQLSAGGSQRAQFVQTDSLIVALRNRR